MPRSGKIGQWRFGRGRRVVLRRRVGNHVKSSDRRALRSVEAVKDFEILDLGSWRLLAANLDRRSPRNSRELSKTVARWAIAPSKPRRSIGSERNPLRPQGSAGPGDLAPKSLAGYSLFRYPITGSVFFQPIRGSLDSQDRNFRLSLANPSSRGRWSPQGHFCA
jgi:hypothetical protein